MPTKREELEQRLVEQAQQAIGKLLDALPETSEISLSDMEQATGVMGQTIMQQTMQRLVERQAQPTSEDIRCEGCGQRMSRRGERKKRVVTRRGEVEVERPYYVCPKCGAGRFPPG
jgi:Zn finger protein HypA/HybF involved in hydrogenase expression